MKELERDLGLGAVVAISIGAMIGSGIFILPALALKIAGPAVILAYLLAGVLVVPAALSKSEMATAMPEAGGTYIYIERGMGPLLGTVAGIGTWFSLSFKGALALVGGVPYLVLLFDLPVTPVALGLATVLILVNVVGAKQTGRLQVGIVVVMLAALGWFVAGSAPGVRSVNYEPFFVGGLEGLLAATGLVFVSYAGVTKVASVAEEIENPDRNIPLGVLGSLTFTTVLYVGIVAVMVGATDAGSVAGSSTPVAVVAEATLGQIGVLAVVGAAILALVSTANAGVLSASRYPFAMSRDQLAPPSFASVSERFGTPVNAITLTGVVVLTLIAFVPILEIAKLASAFQILVFAIVNLAVIAFREGSSAYDPSFESPFYPWTQLVGTVTGFALLTQMGTVPLVGAAVITVASGVWYLVYVRDRVDRTGAATNAIRARLGRDLLADTRALVGDDPGQAGGEGSVTGGDERTTTGGEGSVTGGDEKLTTADDRDEVLVAFTGETSRERERTLLQVAADLAAPRDGGVVVVRFDEVNDQVPLEYAAEVQSPADVTFERQTDELAAEIDVPVTAGEIVSHDTKRAMVNYAGHRGVETILTEHERLRLRSRLIGDPIDWVVRHAPCDVVLADPVEYDRPRRVLLDGDRSTYDPTTVAVADRIAGRTGGTVLLDPATGDESAERSLDAYRAELAGVLSAPVEVRSARPDGGTTGDPDLVVRRGVADTVGGSRDGPAWSCTELTVYPHERNQPGRWRRLIGRFTL